MTIGRGALGALALVLVGCSAATPVQTASVPASDPVERIAQALADADAAAESGERDRLLHAVRLLDATGAKALPDTGDDPLPAWRTLAADASPPMRGSPLGPGYRRGQLEAGQSTRIEQLFLSGKRAKIAVSTPDKGAFTLRVRDARDGSVCDRPERPIHCQWVPVFTQRYSIEIANRGEATARYYLVVE